MEGVLQIAAENGAVPFFKFNPHIHDLHFWQFGHLKLIREG